MQAPNGREPDERHDGGRNMRVLVEQEPRYGSVEERGRGPLTEPFHGSPTRVKTTGRLARRSRSACRRSACPPRSTLPVNVVGVIDGGQRQAVARRRRLRSADNGVPPAAAHAPVAVLSA